MSKSRQINFFLLPEDLQHLEDRWREAVPIAFIEDRVVNGEYRSLRTTAIEEMGRTPLRIFLVPGDRPVSLVMRPTPDGAHHFVDVVSSNVIELGRCYFDGRILRRGRLYVVTYDDSEAGSVMKDDEFRDWARKVFDITRRALRREPDGFYVGDAALVARAEGRIEFKE